MRDNAARCLFASRQVLNEFFSVITKAGRVEHPVPRAEAMAEVAKYYASSTIRRIYPSPGVGARLVELMKAVEVTGPAIYDLYLAATMLENGVTKVYTYDTGSSAASTESKYCPLTPLALFRKNPPTRKRALNALTPS